VCRTKRVGDFLAKKEGTVRVIGNSIFVKVSALSSYLLRQHHRRRLAGPPFPALLLILTFFSPTVLAADWYVDVSVGQSAGGQTWETAFKRIQEGIDAADNGDTVIVAQGIYFEQIVFRGKDISLRSTDPLDPNVVADTVIDAGSRGTVVRFEGTESEASTLSGFTIRNGCAEDQHSLDCGILGGTYECRTHATIEKNVITQNRGGGIRYCDGVIRHNTISLNETEGSGGGLHECDGIIEGNTIRGNAAANDGGGLCRCDGIVRDNLNEGNSARRGAGAASCQGRIEGNTIRGNRANEEGGGLHDCDGPVKNNRVCQNQALYAGGGMYGCDGIIECNSILANTVQGGRGPVGGGLAYCEGAVQNNLICGNRAVYCGGLYRCNGKIVNSVIAHNRMAGVMYAGAGLYECGGEIVNCIIWGNVAERWDGFYASDLYECGQPIYCCIEGRTTEGEGNVWEDLRFVDAEKGDYRLMPDSPCIDAGWNDAPGLPEFDIRGMHRIVFGGRSLRVDMGAYEYYINRVEPMPVADDMIFTWSSIADKTYSIFYSADLLTWHLAADNLPSAGDMTTSWIDDGSLTGTPPSAASGRFYRMLENP
jgi:hypothetical protein